MAAHRAWRLRRTNSNGNACWNAAEVELRASIYGPDLTDTVPGTPIADSIYNNNAGSFGPAKAFDNDPATIWHNNCAASTAGWIGYDFGAEPAHWQDVTYIALRSRSDCCTDQTIRDGVIEWTDDLVGWTVACTITGSTGWSLGELRIYGPVPQLADVGGHRFWRLKETGTAGVTDSYNGLSGLRFLRQGASYGGPGDPGAAVLDSGGIQAGSARSVFGVANPTAALIQWAGGSDHWLGLDFGAGRLPAIDAVQIAANRDNIARTWRSFTLDYSDDGVAWTTALSFTSVPAWTATGYRSFPDQPPPPPTTAAAKVGSYVVAGPPDVTSVAKLGEYVIGGPPDVASVATLGAYVVAGPHDGAAVSVLGSYVVAGPPSPAAATTLGLYVVTGPGMRPGRRREIIMG